ncbi:MAG: hypothetical protein ABJZ55_10430 [Fuerstiella sp.]
MATIADTAAVDPARTIARLAEGLSVQPQVYDGQTFYHLQWESEDKNFRVGYEEYVFLSLLDGQTTFSEALALTTRALSNDDDDLMLDVENFGDATAAERAIDCSGHKFDDSAHASDEFTQQRAMELYRWLLQNGLATVCDEWSGRRESKSTKSPSLLQRFNPLWLKIPLGNPGQILKSLQPVVGWIFSPIATIVGCLFIVAATLRLWFHWSDFQTASETVLAPDNWLWLLIAWVGLKFVHETAHGLACLRYGGTVSKTGIILAVFAPLAWIDLSSSWKFSSRWHRIHTAAAGMYVEFLLAAAAVFAFASADNQVVAHLLFDVIFMASVTTLLFNANPLMKFDGYFILSDLMQIPNLAQEAQTAVRNLLKHIFFGLRSTQSSYQGRKQLGLVIYGILAAIWKVLICASLLLAASVLFHGAGIALVIFAVAAWVGIPAIKQIKNLKAMWRQVPLRVTRAFALAACLFVTIGYGIWNLPAPFPAVSPGVVSLPEGNTVRVSEGGFVDEIFVQPGQSVSAGDSLFRIANDEVTNTYLDLSLQVQQEAMRQQIAMDEKDAGEAALSRKKLNFLNDRLQQAKRRHDELIVKAKTAGVILGAHIPELQDRHVEEGAVICLIYSGRTREFRISVDQFDYSLAEAVVGDVVPVRLGTRGILQGQVVRVIPRASRRLKFPALAAHSGGPLAVKPVSDERGEDELQLVDQRFEAVILLESSTLVDLPIGERGYAILGQSDRTVASWAYHSARTWVASTLDAATAMQ